MATPEGLGGQGAGLPRWTTSPAPGGNLKRIEGGYERDTSPPMKAKAVDDLTVGTGSAKAGAGLACDRQGPGVQP